MKNIIDNTKSEHEEITFFTLIKTNNILKSKANGFEWVYLCILELLFGADLLKSFNSSCLYSDEKEKGRPLHLNRFIPNKLMMNLLKGEVRKLMYYKFFLRYKIIEPKVFPLENEVEINCTRYSFHVNKVLVTQFQSMETVYAFVWFLINLIIDLIVYILTTDIIYVLSSIIFVEGIRRLFRI